VGLGERVRVGVMISVGDTLKMSVAVSGPWGKSEMSMVRLRGLGVIVGLGCRRGWAGRRRLVKGRGHAKGGCGAGPGKSVKAAPRETLNKFESAWGYRAGDRGRVSTGPAVVPDNIGEGLAADGLGPRDPASGVPAPAWRRPLAAQSWALMGPYPRAPRPEASRLQLLLRSRTKVMRRQRRQRNLRKRISEGQGGQGGGDGSGRGSLDCEWP